MDTFRDQVIIITGASEGIGRATALRLAREGPRMVLAARNRNRLEEAAEACRGAGAQALVSVTDVTSAEACRELVQRSVTAFGRIDALVNNAGGTMWTRFDEVGELGIFEHLMRLNYLSAVWCTHYALPHLKQSRGRLVAVSSLAGLGGVPTRTGYSAAKHALMGFFDSLRIELDGSGVSVTVVAPDFVLSEIHRRALGPDGKPLGASPLVEARIMTADQCAERLIEAMRRRSRLEITSPRGKLARWLRLVAPGWVDRMAAQAIRRRY